MEHFPYLKKRIAKGQIEKFKIIGYAHLYGSP